ncbi:MAG: cytochrome c family protein [Myxococcales bacterium]|nr:cytochrome c family protein [Myxococcales bacterium]
MRARLHIWLVLAIMFGTASADPKSPAKAPAKHHHSKAKPKPKPAPVPAPTPPPAPAPVPDPPAATPAPAPEPVPADSPSSAPASNAPGAALPAREPPPLAPRLAMRPRTPAHEGFVGDMDCSACHNADGWKLAAGAGASGFDHDRTGFPLRGSHVQTQCSGCHTGTAVPATNCEGCHRDPHAGRNNGTCAECHTATAWSDTRTLDQHRNTRMPLTGRHATIDCSACHKRNDERRWSGVPADCYSCHKAQYHDATVHPTHDGAGGQPAFSRDCGLCHRTISWSPAVADPTALARTAIARTGEHDAFFVLTSGSHRTAECSACHADPRRTKLVRCDGCHQDTAVRAQHREPVGRGAVACLRCHPRGAAR